MDASSPQESGDPYALLKRVVMESLQMPDEPLSRVNIRESASEPKSPGWPTGLVGSAVGIKCLRGVTVLSGESGAGKTWMALCSSIDASRAGWKVIYLAAEMGASDVARRAVNVCDGAALPRGFHLHTVDFGVDIKKTVKLIADEIDNRPLLVVVDSLSSFVDQATYASVIDDPHAIGPLKQFMMWALNVKRRTRGRVSFLLLSELNAAGVTKGRFADYKADVSVYLRRYEETGMESARVVNVKKNWDGEDGSMGIFGLKHSTGRMIYISAEAPR
jgi:predicted ATP-dependent serine protease